jgi:hypothetical protein
MRRMLAATFAALAFPAAADHKIHMIYMGGNDCPPCRAWRATELPKLKEMEAFKRTQFVYVEKLIGSTVPPSLFLPSEARPYKDMLDAAANGLIGSPQTAIIVDGKLYDYYYGSRAAADIERMLKAIYDGKPYPFPRCLKRESASKCATKA